MKYPVYAIRDLKAGFGQPIVSLNDQTMIRTFSVKINQIDEMSFAPADYQLFKIGTFDTDSGAFDPQLAEFVISGSDVYGDKAK